MYVEVDIFFCFFKQKTAYELRISDWSSDVCSSDLARSAHAISPAMWAGTLGQDRLRAWGAQRVGPRCQRQALRSFWLSALHLCNLCTTLKHGHDVSRSPLETCRLCPRTWRAAFPHPRPGFTTPRRV